MLPLVNVKPYGEVVFYQPLDTDSRDFLAKLVREEGFIDLNDKNLEYMVGILIGIVQIQNRQIIALERRLERED